MEGEKDTAAEKLQMQVKLRMPKVLQEQLKCRARANVRTMNSEAVHLLQQAMLEASTEARHAQAA